MSSYFNREWLMIYHGSTVNVQFIDLSKGKDYKDFGKGFYTTSSKIQAEKFAKLLARRRKTKGYVSEYKADKLIEGLSFKEFKTADIEWLDFVVFNRTHAGKQHPYDIVIGPVADDDTNIVIQAYMNGVYGNPDYPTVKSYVISLLEPENLKNQIYIGTDRAVSRLTYIGGYVL